MTQTLLTLDLRYEQDVVLTRQRARQISALLEFSPQEQTAIATAVSEIARNAHRYAGGGKAEFIVTDTAIDARPVEQPRLVVEVRDRGPGIAELETILAGHYRSTTGMGLGILGCKRLSDEFHVDTAPGSGTTVAFARYLPKRAARLTRERLAQIAAALSERVPQGPLEEIQQQNRELLVALEALQGRSAEVNRLNVELEETNRGVLALYKELDDRAVALQRASELKSRFLSDLSHELRTPLNAVVSLTGLLLDHVDGPLEPEQEKQVRLIRKSAQSLTEMVNDLLDLAKIEAGKTDLHIGEFSLAELLTALRGMFRPLLSSDAIALIVEEPIGVVMMRSDEAKLSQILRNFISNAVKFTERGEIRVRTEALDGDRVRFSVSDTGIGIAPSDQHRVFQDFTQLDGPVQRRVRGTGLGLPLTKKLAKLLGGDVTLESQVGTGSTFSVILPVNFAPAGNEAAGLGAAAAAGGS